MENDGLTLSGPGIDGAFAIKANAIQIAYQAVMDEISSLPPSRAKSIAITELETSQMWLGKALLETIK